MIELLSIVQCELCGTRVVLYPSERHTLDENPRLTISCDACVEDFRRDPLAAERKRLQRDPVRASN